MKRFAGVLGLLLVLVPGHPAAAAIEDDRRAMLERINEIRRARALPELALEAKLNRIAQDHAEELAARDELSHTGLRGSRLSDRLAGVGYRFRMAAENLSGGQDSPGAVVAAWMESPAHRRNLLLPDFEELGLGHAVRAGGKDFWVLVLAAPFGEGAYPLGVDPGLRPEMRPRTVEPPPPEVAP